MGKIGQARGFLFFRIVNKFFFRKRKKNKNYLLVSTSYAHTSMFRLYLKVYLCLLHSNYRLIFSSESKRHVGSTLFYIVNTRDNRFKAIYRYVFNTHRKCIDYLDNNGVLKIQ